MRTVSDVPYGVFLSGGYDSVSVASLLSKKTDTRIKTFTIGFDDRDYDESEQARELSQYLGTDHKQLILTEDDLLDILHELPEIFDEPFGDSSSIPTIAVSRLAAQDVKVVLSGDGGDENFFGYGKYLHTKKLFEFYKKYSVPSISDKLINDKSLYTAFSFVPFKLKKSNLVSKTLKILRLSKCSTIESLYIEANKYFLDDEVRRLLSVTKLRSIAPLSSMRHIDFSSYLPEDILQKVDRASMNASIESREPILDHRIVELSARIPESVHYNDEITKSLLKKVVHRYVPQELMSRKKKGFSIPIDKWLQGKLKNDIDKYINSDFLSDIPYLNSEEVIFLKESYYNKRGVNPHKIWFIYTFVKWYQRWMMNVR